MSLLLALLLMGARAPSPGLKPSFGGVLAAGKFLVATRQITDGVFRQTVILLLRHDSQGTLGLIVNRPMKIKLSKVFPDVEWPEKNDDIIYFGGPVEGHQAHFLLRAGKEPPESEHVFGDVYASASMGTLERLAKGASGGKVRAYSGYAGWARGQLEMEIGRGDWHIVPADAPSIFELKPEEVWDRLSGTAPGTEI